ncbi:MAG: tetratricopeptide repeat protein, partial [Candidatus Binatia bacterium]
MRRIGALAIVAVAAVCSGTVAEMSDEERAAHEASAERSVLEEEALMESGAAPSALEREAAAAGTGGGATALAEGKELYRKGDYTLALERFLAAQASDRDDAEASLMLGLTYLQLDDPQKAAVQWAEYVKDTDDRKLADDVRKYVTILLHEANHRAAEEAIRNEKQLSDLTTNARTVAVGAFRNLGSAEYAPFGKALAAMLIDNLQGIPEVAVLEREQVQALVEEANLAEKGLVEQSTAVRAGKLLRAGTVAAGSHIDWTASPTRLKVEAVLVDVDDASQLASASEENQVESFHEIIPKIAGEFAPVLTKKPLADLPPEQVARVTEDHTKSLPAALAFGRALDAKDRKDSDEARRNCRDAEKADPDFELAKRTCGLIPPVWMSSQGVVST